MDTTKFSSEDRKIIKEMSDILSKDPYRNTEAIKLYWMLSESLTWQQVEEKWKNAGFGHDSYCAEIGKAQTYLKISDPMASIRKEFPGEFNNF